MNAMIMMNLLLSVVRIFFQNVPPILAFVAEWSSAGLQSVLLTCSPSTSRQALSIMLHQARLNQRLITYLKRLSFPLKAVVIKLNKSNQS